jgi:hypothetical protein
VVITPAENKVRMFNPAGSRIWELMNGQRTVGQIIDLLIDEFDVEPERAHRTAQEFLAMLDEKNMIAWADQA